MTELWYYWHASDIMGPFSGKQLVALAAAGDILPDDIVWKEGIEGGVPAHKVQHLFVTSLLPTPVATPVASEGTPLAIRSDPAAAAGAHEATKEVTPVEVPQAKWDGRPATQSGKARAVAGKGTIIVGQDGSTVKFRMKCTTCGHEDSSWQSTTITRGTTRKTFYCPKCRKRCSVEIHGHIG